jgi:hypothetical protein
LNVHLKPPTPFPLSQFCGIFVNKKTLIIYGDLVLYFLNLLAERKNPSLTVSPFEIKFDLAAF